MGVEVWGWGIGYFMYFMYYGYMGISSAGQKNKIKDKHGMII